MNEITLQLIGAFFQGIIGWYFIFWVLWILKRIALDS